MRLLVSGDRLSIFGIRAPNGTVPLIDDIQRVTRQYKHLESAYATRWKRMALHGPEAMKPDHYHKWKREKDPRIAMIHGAFKDLTSKTRIPAFFDGKGKMILTHLLEGKKENALSGSDKLETLNKFNEYQMRKKQLLQSACVPKRRVKGRR